MINLKKIAFGYFVIVFIFYLTFCAADNDSKKGKTNIILDYEAFLDLLNTAEFTYREVGKTVTFLSVESKGIYIGDELVTIYEYSTNELMETDSQHIDEGGCSISYPDKGVSISWVSFPHFFKKDLIIVNYVGEDMNILDFLKENCGNEFAGYGYVNRTK